MYNEEINKDTVIQPKFDHNLFENFFFKFSMMFKFTPQKSREGEMNLIISQTIEIIKDFVTEIKENGNIDIKREYQVYALYKFIEEKKFELNICNSQEANKYICIIDLVCEENIPNYKKIIEKLELYKKDKDRNSKFEEQIIWSRGMDKAFKSMFK